MTKKNDEKDEKSEKEVDVEKLRTKGARETSPAPDAPEGLEGKDDFGGDQQIESTRPPASKPAAVAPEDLLATPVAPTAGAKPEGVSKADSATTLNFTGGGVAQPRLDPHVYSNRDRNFLPEGQKKIEEGVAPTPSGREIAQHNQKNTPGFGEE